MQRNNNCRELRCENDQDINDCLNQGHSLLVLLRGLSGSGKTELARLFYKFCC